MQETQLSLERLVVIKLDVSVWSGRKKLRKEDLGLAGGSEWPPEDLASLGSKRITDPKSLLVFSRLKKEAERRCLQVGTRFLGGFAIPEAALNGITVELERLSENFDEARESYLQRYDQTIEDWVRRHPGFEAVIRKAIEPPEGVRRALHFDFVVFRVTSPSDGTADRLSQKVGSLGDQLFEEIAQMARHLVQESLIGRETVTRKVLSPFRRILRKLEGLSFLDERVNPIIETLKDLLNRAPRAEISGSYLLELLATGLLLSDPPTLQCHGVGLKQGVEPCEPPDNRGLPDLWERTIDSDWSADMTESDFDPIPQQDLDSRTARTFWF